MRTVEQTARKVISAKEVYVGIDVHKESWHVTVRSDGEERFNGRIPGQHHSLKRVLERYRDVRIKERREMAEAERQRSSGRHDLLIILTAGALGTSHFFNLAVIIGA